MSEEEATKQRVTYEQNFRHASTLNDQLNRVPAIAMTLTGGLWFGAGVTEDIAAEIRFGLLLFAGFCDLGLVLIAFRTRDVLHSYLEKIEEYYPPAYASGRPSAPIIDFADYSMIATYCSLMLIGAGLSFLGAFFFYWPFSLNKWLGIVLLFVLMIVLYKKIFTKITD